ncbi:MAG: hypothetical protein WC533_04755 [Candidatus Pacearchaeota archaeon]
MTKIIINIDEQEEKILNKRAKKNLLTLKEQVEDIVRRSCITFSNSPSTATSKCDDALVDIFSRQKKGKRG